MLTGKAGRRIFHAIGLVVALGWSVYEFLKGETAIAVVLFTIGVIIAFAHATYEAQYRRGNDNGE